MNSLDYTIEISSAGAPVTLTGACALRDGATHVVLSLPEGTLTRVSARVRLGMKDRERLFLNGYQTWTWCPEYTKRSRIRGIRRLPKAVVRAFHLDRYADYHFVEYPYRRGVLHGVSYGYLRDGAFFRLFASLDEEPGYTLFQFDCATGELTLERDCAGLACGGEFHAFDLFFASGDEDTVFDRWFAELGVTRRPAEPLRGYSSWYNRYEKISEASILADLAGCAEVLSPGDLFQVDDGWEPNVGDWLEADAKKFPNGMKTIADAIHGRGLRAGLWLAPFVCRAGSRIEREHPDWLLRVNGKKWACGINWGGFYALDIDHPEVQAYLRETFRRVFDVWGFDLVKLDFLYGAAPFGNARETRAGRMLRAMRFLREVCGEHAILGCGVPVMPAFGLVEYCRVSCDVGLDWDDKPYMRIIHRERVSTKHAMETSIFRRQLNGRAYLSDPDVFFLREDHIRLTPAQKKSLAETARAVGGVFLSSDNMGDYDAAQRAEYRRLAALTPIGRVRVETENGLKLRFRTADGETVVDVYAK